MVNFPGSDPFSSIQSSGASGTQTQNQVHTDIAALKYLATLQPTQQTQQLTNNILGQLDQLATQNSQPSNSPMNESQQVDSLAAWMHSQSQGPSGSQFPSQGPSGSQFPSQGPSGSQFPSFMDPASYNSGFHAGYDLLASMHMQDQQPATNPTNGPASSTTSTNGDQTTTMSQMQNGDNVGFNNGDTWSNMDSGGVALHGHNDGSIQLSSTKEGGGWGNATWSDTPSWMQNGGGSPPSAQDVTDEVNKIKGQGQGQGHCTLDANTIRQFLAQQYMNSNWNGSLDKGTIGTNIAPAFGVDPTALYKTYHDQGGKN